MSEKNQTKARLTAELAELRQRVAELEAAEAEWVRKEKTLRETEEQYRTLFEHANDAIYLLEPETGAILDCNEKAAEMDGYSVAELKTMTAADLHPPEERALLPAKFAEVAEKGLATGISDLHHLRKDGRLVPIEVNATLVEVGGGEQLNLSVVRDITERKQSEEALRKSERSLLNTQRLARVGSWVWDIQTGEVEWSGEVYRIFGLDPEAFQPEIDSVMSRFHSDDRQLHEELIAQAIANREQYSFEARILLPDGSVRFLISTSEGYYDDDGSLTQISGIVQDITERKQAEEALRRSEERLRLALRAARMETWEWDILTHEVSWSKGVELMFGLEPGDFDGTYAGYLELTHPEDRDRVVQTINRSVEALDDYHIQHRMIWPNGEVHWLEGYGRVLCDETGRAVRMLGSVIDITRRKQADEALRHSEAFLDSIIEYSPYAMWISDDKGTLIRLNQACRDLLHITNEEVVGKYNVLQDNIVKEQGFLPLVKQVFEAGKTAKFTIEYDSSRLEDVTLQQPTFVILETTISPVQDGHGSITNAIIQHINITERKQAEEALRHYTTRLENLRQIDQAILEAHSPEEIAQAALQHLRHLVPCRRISVTTFDMAVRQATVTAVDMNGETQMLVGSQLSLDVFGGVLEELQLGQVWVVPDVLALTQPTPVDQTLQKEGVRSYVNVPLIMRKELIGVLDLEAGEPDAFNEEQVKIAREVADQLAIALRQAQLHEQVQQHAEELEQRVNERTSELRKMVNLMAGREVRMAELKEVIRKLRAQLEEAGLEPVADDPLLAGGEM
jgi:PAS domain S-box-containing protein